MTDGRPFRIKGIEPSLQKAKDMLEIAREGSWPIFHIRHLQEGEIFNRDSEFSEFVEGFEPQETEKIFIKNDFSCFSSDEFKKEMEKHRESEIVIIGYNSTMCCLSTVIDGYHRGYKLTFVKDASHAKAKSFDEETTHAHMTDVISNYAAVAMAKNFEL